MMLFSWIYDMRDKTREQKRSKYTIFQIFILNNTIWIL